MSDSSRVARNASWLIAQPILVGLISIVVMALVARALGASTYGTLLLFLSYGTLCLQISNLGLRPFSVRTIAADPQQASRIVSDMLVLRAILATVVMLVATPLLLFIDRSLSVLLIAILFLQLLLNALAGCFIDGLQGLERMKPVAASFAVSGIFVQLASIAALYLDLGILGIVGAYVLGSVMLLLMVWVQFGQVAGQEKLQPRHRWAQHLQYIHASHMLLWQNVISALRGRLDLLLINGMLGTYGAGIYGSSMVLIQRLDLIQDGIATAIFPRVANLYNKSIPALQSLVRGTLKVVLVICCPIAVGLVFTSEQIVSLLFGTAFAESAAVLQILGLGVPLMFVSGVLYNVLRALGHERELLVASLVTMVAAVVLFPLGIWVWGVRGAAAAFCLCGALSSVQYITLYWKLLGVPWVWRELALLVIANAAMAGALWLVCDAALGVKIAVAVVVYALIVRLLGLATVAMLRGMFSSRGVSTDSAA